MKSSSYLLIISITFVLVELLSAFTYSIGDDLVYYYMGQQVNEGKDPYTDFFFAHPPLQLAFYALAFGIVGYHLFAMKLLFIIFTVLNAWLIFLICRHYFKKDNIGLIAATLFLFCPTILYNSSFEMGLTVATTLFLLGVLWDATETFHVGGVCFMVLTSFYRFHFLPVILAYYAWRVLVLKTKHSKVQASVFVIAFLVFNILLSLTPNYSLQVFGYHLEKPSEELHNKDVWQTVVKSNYLLFLAPVLVALNIFEEWDDKERRIRLFFAPVVIFIIFLMLNKTIFGYYFMVIMPFLAILSAYYLAKLLHYPKLITLIIMFFITINAWNYLTLERTDLSPLDNYIESSNSVMVGDPTLVSYFALKYNKEVLNDDIDLNNMRIESGLLDAAELVKDIKEQHALLLVKTKEGLYGRLPEIKELTRGCQQLVKIPDGEQDIILAQC